MFWFFAPVRNVFHQKKPLLLTRARTVVPKWGPPAINRFLHLEGISQMVSHPVKKDVEFKEVFYALYVFWSLFEALKKTNWWHQRTLKIIMDHYAPFINQLEFEIQSTTHCMLDCKNWTLSKTYLLLGKSSEYRFDRFKIILRKNR